MLIHHQDGTKLGIEMITDAALTEQGRLILKYKSPKSKARGIVEFSPQESKIIMEALAKQYRVHDSIVMKL